MGPVTVGFIPFGQLNNLRVLAYEYVSVNNAQNVVSITPASGIDVTSSVVSQTSAVLTFLPTGDGYPVRFWRVKLVWQYTVIPGNQVAPAFTSPITINSSYY
jgi:Na+/H+ antiporter NhaD/arsenite permease-like protein